MIRSKAPAHKALALRPESRSRSQSQAGGLDQLLAKRDAVGHAAHTEEGIQSAGRRDRFNTVDLTQLAMQKFACRFQARDKVLRRALAFAHRRHPRALHEHLRA